MEVEFLNLISFTESAFIDILSLSNKWAHKILRDISHSQEFRFIKWNKFPYYGAYRDTLLFGAHHLTKVKSTFVLICCAHFFLFFSFTLFSGKSRKIEWNEMKILRRKMKNSIFFFAFLSLSPHSHMYALDMSSLFPLNFTVCSDAADTKEIHMGMKSQGKCEKWESFLIKIPFWNWFRAISTLELLLLQWVYLIFCHFCFLDNTG